VNFNPGVIRDSVIRAGPRSRLTRQSKNEGLLGKVTFMAYSIDRVGEEC